MMLSKEQIASLLDMLRLTREREATCADCHQAMAEFAEAELEGRTIRQGLEAIQHHLELCSECREEFEALLNVLRES